MKNIKFWILCITVCFVLMLNSVNSTKPKTKACRKPYVQGKNCDICKDGYFLYNKLNPNGCETCTCNIKGTVNASRVCDKLGGDCTCKRNVEGRDCMLCKPHYYELSQSDPNGCRPCECDPDGAENDYCDPITGQCRCKSYATGRSCNVF